jgi:pimeloyl-ACP methyl ester carboxylesterase
MTPERFRISANGLSFEVLAWGEADGPLALCLHGFPDTPWTWRELGPYLAERGWRVVAPFLRGYAPTDLAPDDDYAPTAVAGDAIALHAALKGDDRAVLIGHDWGAIATWEVTHRAPSTFGRYVTLAVPPLGVLLELRHRRHLRVAAIQLRKSWYTIFNQVPGVAERSLDKLVPKLWRDWSPGFQGRGDAETALTALHDPAHRRAALRYYRDSLRPAALRLAVPPPGAPALYLHGVDDGCLDIGTLALAEPLLAPGSRARAVEDAGHFLQLERPGVVNEAIATWIGTP